MPCACLPADVLQAFTDKLASIAQPLRKMLTYDRGKKMAHHQQLSANRGAAVYFWDPNNPWQRGTIENTNDLVRQYLPTAPTSQATAWSSSMSLSIR